MFPFRILLPALIFLFIAKIRCSPKRIIDTRVGNYLGFLGFWLFYAAVSMLWAADKVLAIKDIALLFTGVSVAFFTVYYLKSLRHLENLSYIWVGSMVLMLILGLWEIQTGNHLPLSSYVDPISIADQNRPSAVFYNTNDLAFFLALCLPFIYVWIFSKGRVPRKALALALFVAALFVLAMTTSRSAQLGLIAAVVFDFAFLRGILGKWKVLAITGLVTLALITLFPDQTREIETTMGLRFQDLPLEFSQGSARLAVASGVPELLTTSYGMGVGAGNADYYLHLSKIDLVTGFTALHNLWLEILANYGIIIFIGYLGFHVSLFLALLRSYRRTQDGRGKRLCEAALMGMVAFPIANLAVSSAMALPQTWMFLGFALAVLNQLRVVRAEQYRSNLLLAKGA
jgi:teichuronic acid biosynthesis protein TuaE